MRHRWLAVAALIFVAGSWGATFPLIKSILQQVEPEAFIALRFAIAGLALVAFAAARRTLRYELLVPGLVLGLLVFIGYWMQTRALVSISPSRSAFLTGLYVVMVPFADRAAYRSRVSGLDWAASVMAAVGTAALIGGFDARPTLGDALTLACAV
ncbi:MAG TPA: DMT family transporter, partial [Thermoanaerobaculia bacterium]|nr:DMT family transporter [Thermoanaerobaculia bacterium]